MTTWLPVTGYEGRYEVSSSGAVRSLGPRGRVLRPQRVRDTLCVFLSTAGKSYCIAIRRVVATAFLGEAPEGQTIHFRDGDRDNAEACNLYYARPTSHLDTVLALLPSPECVPWPGAIDHDGYPTSIRLGGSRPRPMRHIYKLVVGPIPAGLHLDHLCHTFDLSCAGGPGCLHRRCVNPAHLEPVTPTENAKRGAPARAEVCKRGHAAWGRRPNTGRRYCRVCAGATSLGVTDQTLLGEHGGAA